MFDTMTMTKVLGGVCGTLLVFLLGGWLAEEVYHADGYGDDRVAGYTIEVASNEDAGAEVEEGPAFAEVFAAASAADGESQWRACSACHALEDGVNGVGPHLYGVVGRDVAAVGGYNYSGALIAVNDVWTAEELNAFLENPRNYAPGTAMGYNGMRRIEDRANLIAYLDSLDD
ncbi:c-type cytochrome [Pseudooctadecabacter sp.]|uniref:c-type cytochrome n=1 Tax=Pseudooctadecabacter sp. TaxID=1966338 RepID=UPI0035C7C8C5